MLSGIPNTFARPQIFTVLLFFFSFLLPPESASQNGTGEDTVKTRVHNPKLAMILSTVLPGAGQAYNKKYWKIPVIYTGIGAFGYMTYRNNNYYKTFRQAYTELYNSGNSDSTVVLYGVDFTLNGLEAGKNYYRRYRDLFAIFTFGVYLLNIIDANVDAHLFDFDISDDLTMRIYPETRETAFAGSVPGIRICIYF